MTESVLRDVYFWSATTGVITLSDAWFNLNPWEREPGSKTDCAPLVNFTTDDASLAARLTIALGVHGLLWTATKDRGGEQPRAGHEILDMIPAVLDKFSADVDTWETQQAGAPRWSIRSEWISVAPFVAHGFSRPEPIEAEGGA